MAPRFSGWFWTLLCVGLALLTMATTRAELSLAGIAPPAVESETPTDATRTPGVPNATPALVGGFRSARFGMSEEQVRAAIRRDFPAVASTLTSAVNQSEKTTVLSLVVPDLVPGSGKAHISFIFGYRSKKLIQVNIVWSSDQTAASDVAIVAAANSLRDYFLSEHFPPNSIAANRQLAPNTILVFRGSDAQKRAILLVLSGAAARARGATKKDVQSPLTLELSYIENAANPDVFRISKGQF